MYHTDVVLATYICFGFSVIAILVFAPLANKNHPLSERQMSRNIKLLYRIILLQEILYVLTYQINVSLVFSQMIFVCIVGVILCVGVIEHR